MGLEEAHVSILVERNLLKVKAGGVNVRCKDLHAILLKITASNTEYEDALALLVKVFFVTDGELVTEFILGISLCLNKCDGSLGSLALGLGIVKILHISDGIVVDSLDFLGGRYLKNILFLVRKLLVQFFCSKFRHFYILLKLFFKNLFVR